MFTILWFSVKENYAEEKIKYEVKFIDFSILSA